MKNSLLSTTSGYLDAFTSKTMHSCSSWLNSLKAGHSFWLVVFLVTLSGVSSPGLVLGQSADLDQIRNGGPTTPINPPNWVNGNANATQAHYLEGHSIAYRMIVDDLGTNAAVEHTLVIAYDHKKGTKNAIDFITHYQNLDPHHTSNGGPFNHFAENIKVLKGLNGAANAHLDYDSVLVNIVAPSTLNASALATFNALPLAKRQMVMYGGGVGGSINAFSAASYSYAGEETQLVIKFHSSNNKVVFAWGGHIATSTNWGNGNSAVFIPGSPYHTRLISIDGKGGNQDRALAAAAVVPLNPPSCLVVGDTITCAGADNMVFRAITDQPSISSYAWSVINSGGANAAPVGATNLDTIVVDPGTNGGSFSVQVTITKVGAPNPTICNLEVDVEDPDAVATVEDELTCTTTEVQLFGSGGGTYSWTGPNNFNSPLQNPMVSEPGWYYLTVTTASGTCSDTDSVEVIENITNIQVSLGGDVTLNCNDDDAEICPSVLPAGINYDFSWALPGGSTSTDSCITVGAGGGGEYILTVTNPLNGCVGKDTIQVIEDFTNIQVSLGGDVTLNCNDDDAEICPSVLPAGINYDFSWALPGGSTSTDSCITVGAGGGGEYILTVTNPLNGCVGKDTIQVIEDFDKPNIGVGGPYNIACGQTSIQLNGTSTDGVLFEWKVVSGSVSFSSSTDEDPTATVNSVSATVRFIVTGANGCVDSADVNITKAVCGDKHCTLTQGAYGNANGKFCGGPRRLELINNLLAQGDLTIGVLSGLNTRSITFKAGQGQCIIDAMPAGGTAAALPVGYGHVSSNNGCPVLGPVLSKNKRFNNVFIGQVLALSLNSRLDGTLGSVVLTSTITTYKASDCGPDATPILTDVISRTIPQSVLTYLGANATVADLLVLANNALGGVYVPSAGNPSISDINAAVSAINEVFDECRILAANQVASFVKTQVARTDGQGSISATSDKFVKAYPNPFTDKATIEFMTAEDLRYSLEMYDINGRLVSRLSEGTSVAGKAYNFEISAGNLPEGVYLVRFITDRYIETLKVIYKK